MHLKESICQHEIRHINWACQDADDLTHFAYITKNQQTENNHFCHVFHVSTMVGYTFVSRVELQFELQFEYKSHWLWLL